MFVFLTLVELESQNEAAILKALNGPGFSETYLQSHWACFASDDASVMLGNTSSALAPASA